MGVGCFVYLASALNYILMHKKITWNKSFEDIQCCLSKPAAWYKNVFYLLLRKLANKNALWKFNLQRIIFLNIKWKISLQSGVSSFVEKEEQKIRTSFCGVVVNHFQGIWSLID